MNNTQHTIKNKTRRRLTRLLLVTVSFALTATSTAAMNDDTAYVDSVHQWGAWALDIEPAAGGLQAQTTQALNARDSKLRLRTNSISALAPRRPEAITITRAPTPLPVSPASGPAAPTTFAPPAATPPITITPPPSPNIGPVTSGTTVPSGTSGLF